MTASLDDLLQRDDILIVPGAYDALSAKIAMQMGAQAIYMTGFGVSGASFGLPDIGLVSAAEMTDRVKALAGACAPMPLIADGDNGHGGPLNAARLTASYEQAGAACIQIEDQVFPKRCGHMENKEVVSIEEAVSKIRAAAGARSSTDFMIMARTDARATHGFDEALLRADAFLKAGADILFIEAPRTHEEMRRIGEVFAGVPLVANLVEDGKTPMLAPAELQSMGYKIALYPVSALLSVAARLQDVYAQLLSRAGPDPAAPRESFSGYNEIVGLPQMLADAAALTQEAESP